MSAKQVFEHLSQLHNANIKSISDLIKSENSDFSFVDIASDPVYPTSKYEFLFSVGTDRYLLQYNMERSFYGATYKTYKIERDAQSFGNFLPKHLENLDIIYNGGSDSPFGFAKPLETKRENSTFTNRLSHISNFGKDYLTAIIEHG